MQKAVRKGRTQAEVDEIIEWLTGYSAPQIEAAVQNGTLYGDFFRDAPQLNPDRVLIKGNICGAKLESIEEPLMKEIRYLDSLPQFRRDEGFYRLWTLKESFVKATGRGLDLPLRSFWVDIRRGRPQIDCGNIEGQYKLFELDFPADKAYRLAVCVRDLSESEPHLMIL